MSEAMVGESGMAGGGVVVEGGMGEGVPGADVVMASDSIVVADVPGVARF